MAFAALLIDLMCSSLPPGITASLSGLAAVLELVHALE